MNLNYFDWILIAILTWSTIMAFVRGLLLELFGLGGLIAGILLAAWNYPAVASVLGHVITEKAVANVVAFLFIAVVVMILCALVGKALHHTANAIGLGFFDRLLGAVFGYLRGCLLCVAILMAVTAFLPPTTAVAKSSLTPYFLAGAHAVSFVVPHDLRQLILNGAEQLKHTAPDWIKRHE
ncbi:MULTISPECIES: CvpA family protein [Acidobacteriaceae]|uniref:CvpA family protein n=1 Tax=Acidobacteriaceae TaxID=204434 RepID=UPI0020B1506D|nr:MULTISPECIES: CvpA family protein [Acidobacteriaceae]MDW5266737.1 CvpA family protein [Edaphobacter sp.]